MNFLDSIKQFVGGVQNRYGSNFNPENQVKNMMGSNVNSPQDALFKLYQSGKITQEQYNVFSRYL